MTQALLQQLRGHVHFDQGSGVAVPKIMNPNLLYLGKLAASLHFPVQEMLVIGKQAVIRLKIIAALHVVLEAVAEDVRDCDRSVAFWRLGRRDSVLSVNALIALADPDGLLLQIHVRRCEGQQLPFPNSRVVQGHENGIGFRLVLHRVNELQKFMPMVKRLCRTD